MRKQFGLTELMTLPIRNPKGFSLTELMVTATIIGILSAIAIPAFKGYTKKAKQTEAKVALGALHTAMITFEGEFDSYCPRFDINGFAMDGQLRYRVGFANDFPPPSNVPNPGTATCIQTNDGGTKATCLPGYPQSYVLLDSAINAPALDGTSTTATTYVARANGMLKVGEPDSWTINQAGTLLWIENP